MKRTLLAALVCVSLASAASAATLTANIVGGNGVPYGLVTVEIVAHVTSAEATNSLGLDVRLMGNGGITWTGASQVGLTSSIGGGLPWTLFPPICSGADPCIAVNQGNPVLPAGAQPDAFDGVIATATGIASGVGVYSLELVIVDFFGASGSTQNYTPIPEPATAGLLCLGLLGLGLARRRR